MAEVLKKELDTDPQHWNGFEDGLLYTGPTDQKCPVCGEGNLKRNAAYQLVCIECGSMDSDSFSGSTGQEF
jgi:uncharacterized protein (DUF983 family)